MNPRTDTEIKKISLGRDTVAKVDGLLFSKLEGKVPYGAWQTYITRLIQEDFRRTETSSDILQEMNEGEERLRRSQNPLDESRQLALRYLSEYLSRQMNVEDQCIYQRAIDLLRGT